MENHCKSVDLPSYPAMLLLPLSHLKLNKPKASRVESQYKGKEVQQSKAQGFSSTPWVPFHQELLKIFFTLLFLSVPTLLLSEVNCWLPWNHNLIPLQNKAI